MAAPVFSQIFSAFVFFLPAYVANTGAGFFGGGRALDRGRVLWDGRRVFGSGKTVRGTLAGILVGTLYKVVENLATAQPVGRELMLAFLLASGAMGGDLVGSFIKRRIGIESGESAPLLDQLDFALGALFLATFITPISTQTIIILLLITPIGHLGVNITGFLLHRKEVPW
jgi:CDP-2,3-bis-(O-geranylgeranyl)-sn-glycerol synthase